MATTQYSQLISGAAQQNGVDPTTALGIYQTEGSVTNPNLINATNDVGLMQIQPATALNIDPSLGNLSNAQAALQDPTYNAQIGTLYMAGLQKGMYLGSGSLPVQSPQDLAAAYHTGGVYKDANGNYTQHNGSPGPPGNTVNQYVAKFTNYSGGNFNNSGVDSSSSGTSSSVSPHAIPDQLHLYTGIEGLYRPIQFFSVPSPYLAFVQLTVGGGADKSISGPTKVGTDGSLTFTTGRQISPPTTISPDLSSRTILVTDFVFEEGMAAGAGTFKVNMYLGTVDGVNQLADLVNKYKQITITWGYSNDYQGAFTRSFVGGVLRFWHQFNGTGFNVTIEGMDASLDGTIDKSAYSYAPVTGRASDVVSYIANKHGWKTVIERTTQLYSDDSPSKGPRVFQRQAGQSELSFINSTLCDLAQSDVRSYDNTPFGHYRAFFQDGALHFHSILVDTTKSNIQPVRTYIWGGLGNQPNASVVRDFVMDFTGFALLNNGIGQSTTLATDPISGQVNQIDMVGQRVVDTPLQATHDIGSQDSYLVQGTSAKTQAEAQAKALQKYLSLKDAAFTGNLQILGDPFLRCSDVVHVAVQRDGQDIQQFYDWIVMHITHTIAAGDYNMSCQLIRCDISSLTEGGLKIDASGTAMSDFANLGAQNPITGPLS